MFYRFKSFSGPSSFKFKDPDTGTDFQEKSKEDLITRITLYREQNKLPKIEKLRFVLENYWCALRENVGKCEPVLVRRGLLGYVKGGVALLKTVVYNKYATKEVAEKRASICHSCEYNVIPDAGYRGWVDQLAYHALKDGMTTSKDSSLGECSICTCPLKVKCWIGDDIVLTPDTDNKLPDYCWQKKKKDL